jgi:hypothetical protein
MTSLSELISPSGVAIGNLGLSSWELAGSKVGDGSDIRTGNMDFVFI